jgi:hypothetical protein
MPITYTIDRARQRMLTVATPPVSYDEIVAHLEQERDDGGLPLLEFIDATQAVVDLSAAEVRQLVELLRQLGQRNALGPTAVLVGDDLSYGIGRMVESLVEDVCDVRPFRDLAEAEQWLDAIALPRPPARDP